jgi:hypothetical protein
MLGNSDSLGSVALAKVDGSEDTDGALDTDGDAVSLDRSVALAEGDGSEDTDGALDTDGATDGDAVGFRAFIMPCTLSRPAAATNSSYWLSTSN